MDKKRSRKKKRKNPVELVIESIGSEGVSIGRDDGMVYLVKGAVPGDTVLARPTGWKKRHYEAKVEKVIKASEHRIDAKCEYFGVCGGCSWQNLKYSEQIRWKKKNVVDAFQRIGKIEVDHFDDTLESPDIYKYRNKMEFSFGKSRWLTEEEIHSEEDIKNKDFALGLHIPGRYDKVLDINRCHIQKDTGNDIVNEVKGKAIELGATVFDSREHTGFLRNLIIRANSKGDFMVILVTGKEDNSADKSLLDWFSSEFPTKFDKVSTVLHVYNSAPGPVVSEEPRIISGDGVLKDSILGLDYIISPFSFFQTNSVQLDRFISNILDYAEVEPHEMIWDLYCGTGSITLPASKKALYVYGIELVESAVEDAKKNAGINNINNVDFHCADLHAKETPELLKSLPAPDTVIIDPPRAGMHKNLVKSILEFAPKKIVYVSCNPNTQARDCDLLKENYSVLKVRPVDMFPHTSHVESIAVLERKSSI